MAQDYDKIFKENIEEIALPLAKKLLGINPEKLEEIPDDLQRTIERRPDFLKKVVHKDSTKDYILHIEFQVVDEPKMMYRMLEYYAMLLRNYEVKLKQVVFYIGKGKSKRSTSISQDDLDFKFGLVNIQEISYKEFVNSTKPEEVILAILADFGKDDSITVIDTILSKIKSITKPNLQQQKCVKQLEILSILRNLQTQIINRLEAMALTYNIEDDVRFQQGEEKGEKKGMITAVKRMLAANFSIQQVVDVLKVSKEFVEAIAKSIKK